MASDHTRREIETQVEAWRDAHDTVIRAVPSLSNRWKQGMYDQVVVTARGSTYYLAMTAASLLQAATGVLTAPYPPRIGLRRETVHYLDLLFVQWLAYECSIRKGLNPDAPRHLDQVVVL